MQTQITNLFLRIVKTFSCIQDFQKFQVFATFRAFQVLPVLNNIRNNWIFTCLKCLKTFRKKIRTSIANYFFTLLKKWRSCAQRMPMSRRIKWRECLSVSCCRCGSGHGRRCSGWSRPGSPWSRSQCRPLTNMRYMQWSRHGKALRRRVLRWLQGFLPPIR